MAGPSFEGTTLDAASGVSDLAVDAAPPSGAWASTALMPRADDELQGDAGNVADEVARLETLLAERAHALQSEKAELQRAQHLLRAATISFERTLSNQPDPARLEGQRDAAVMRALEAEAARAEFAFRLDELHGHMRVASAVPPTAQTGEPLDVTCARLGETVRGLSSRLAEAEEARQVADARIVLTEQDLAILRGRAHALERELAEAREQIELETLRARSLLHQLEGTLSARQAAELRGELAGASARRDEGERVLETLGAALESARLAERTARLANEQEASQIQALKQALMRETETAREGADKLARALAEGVALREQLADPRSDQRLEAERSAAQRGIAEQRGRAERMRDALREARHLLGELAASLEHAAKTMPPVARAPHEDARPSEAPTQPGMPTYIEAMEGLEELVALRDEHIRGLTTKLQLERDRTRAIERGLLAVEASAAGALQTAQWAELLALVRSRSL